MRQPDNLPAFCRVHRNGRPLIAMSAPPRRSGLRSALSQIGPFLLGSLRWSRKPHRRAERAEGGYLRGHTKSQVTLRDEWPL